jgi:hypothetical protein
LIQLHTLQLSPRFPTIGTVLGMANTKNTKRLNSVNVRMTDDTLAKLRVVADKEKRTVSNLIDKIVSDWLEEWDKRAQEKR